MNRSGRNLVRQSFAYLIPRTKKQHPLRVEGIDGSIELGCVRAEFTVGIQGQFDLLNRRESRMQCMKPVGVEGPQTKDGQRLFQGRLRSCHSI